MAEENSGKNARVLNDLFIELFNDINKIEERSIRFASGDELTITEVHTMEAIGDSEPKRMSDIASKLKITVSTLTISVNKLVNKGYVHRFICEEDKRVVKVCLTDKGRKILKLHARFHEKMIESVVECLDENENAVFMRCMEKLMLFFINEDRRISHLLDGENQESDDIVDYEVVE